MDSSSYDDESFSTVNATRLLPKPKPTLSRAKRLLAAESDDEDDESDDDEDDDESDDDDCDGDDEEVAPPVAVAPPPPMAVVVQKRKRGINAMGNRFQITKREIETGKHTNPSFATFADADAAYTAERARWDAHKRQKAKRPQSEIRAENMKTSGNNSNLERVVAIEFSEVCGQIDVLNDFVLADICGFFYPTNAALALGIQLKVTASHYKGNPNIWMFRDVEGYPGLPVVCWRVDKKNGWVFDGAVLDERKSRDLGITPGGVNAKLALSGVSPLGMREIVAFLKDHVATRPDRFPAKSKEYLSWKFSGKKAHSFLKERIEIHLFQTHVDQAATFPKDQNGSYDLLAGDGNHRLQLKTACQMKGHTALCVNLQENAGKVDGKRTKRPYAVDAFDELVVYFLDWKNRGAHWWRIPAEKLAEYGYIRTDKRAGKNSILVYLNRWDGKGRVQWTHAFYKGIKALGAFPPEAEAAAGHMLDDFRSGKVV